MLNSRLKLTATIAITALLSSLATAAVLSRYLPDACLEGPPPNRRVAAENIGPSLTEEKLQQTRECVREGLK